MKVLLFLISLVFAGTLSGQRPDPVKWTFDFDKAEKKFIATATIEDGWVIYSQENPDGGPIPTSFYFEESEDYQLEGDVAELGYLISDYDPVFELSLGKFAGEAIFEQGVSAARPGGVLRGDVTFMTCDGEKCLPPATVTFEVKI